MKRVETIIIGGGISGLSAAHFLQKKEISFTLLESSSKIGGVIQTRLDKQFVFENGPNTVLINNSSIQKLIDDCKLNNKMILPNLKSSSKRYVFHKNKPIAVPLNFGQFLKSPILSKSTKLKFLKELISPFQFKNSSVYDFFQKKFGKEFHDNLIEPFLTGIYAGDTTKMSLKHSLKKFWLLKKKYRVLLFGLIKSKKNNINSFSFLDGLSELVRKIEENISNKIELNTQVISIKKNNNQYEIITNSKKTFLCKNIICTIPSFSLSKIIFDEDLSSILKKINYNPIDVFHFVFKKNDIKNKMDGFGILCKPSDKKNYLGIIFNSKIFPHVCPPTYDLFTVLVGGEKQKDILKMPQEELKKIIVNETRDLINCDGDLIYSNYFHWEKAIPQYNQLQENLEESISVFHKKHQNFKIIGNYFSGISVSDCIQKSELVVDELFK